MPQDKPYEAQLKLYEIFVQSAEKVSDRRQASNSFFAGLHSLLVAAATVFSERGLPLIALGCAGIVLSVSWAALILSARRLNAAKFRVVHDLEQPFPDRPFASEWMHLREQRGWRSRVDYTVVEVSVPVLFAFIYLVTMVA